MNPWMESGQKEGTGEPLLSNTAQTTMCDDSSEQKLAVLHQRPNNADNTSPTTLSKRQLATLDTAMYPPWRSTRVPLLHFQTPRPLKAGGAIITLVHGCPNFVMEQG